MVATETEAGSLKRKRKDKKRRTEDGADGIESGQTESNDVAKSDPATPAKRIGKREKKARLQKFREDAIQARKAELELKQKAIQDGHDTSSLPDLDREKSLTGIQTEIESQFVPIPQPLPRLHTEQEERALKSLGIPSWLAHPQHVPANETLAVEDMPGLSSRLKKLLKEDGITSLFAVQCATMAKLLKEIRLYPRNLSKKSGPPDYSVSAPTGSGKTLAYTLPIIQVLETRKVIRLRALVIVPTKDLVSQVWTTFKTYCKGTNLVVFASTGQHSFTIEQNMIVGSESIPGDWKADSGLPDAVAHKSLGGQSKVDILITTPGRLVDHIQRTPAFTLQHLRFLVVDEADRLLSQHYQDWCPVVLDALQPPSQPMTTVESVVSDHPDGIAPSHLEQCLRTTNYSDLAIKYHRPAVQKLLFSATITKSPATIAELGLVNPGYISVGTQALKSEVDPGEYAIPETLEQSYAMTSSSDKPLTLIHLLRSQNIASAVIFTNTVEAANRLATLLQLYYDQPALTNKDSVDDLKANNVAHFSSDLAHGKRKRLLEGCKKGQIRLLIASDLMARGIDLPDIQHVISYDMPGDLRRHVHRIGRTARAGKIGHAWTLVERQEAKYFLHLIKEGGREVKRVRFKGESLDALRSRYDAALLKLQQIVEK